MKNTFLILLFLTTQYSLFAQTDNEVFNSSIKNLKTGQSIEIDGQITVNEEINLEGLKDVKIIGKNKAELSTFNTIPHVLKIENCENIIISDLKMRIGVENIGDAVLEIKNSKNIKIDNCEIGNYGKWAIQIDSMSRDIKINDSYIHHCKESGIQSMSPNLEITNCNFKSNSKIGRIKPDLNFEFKNDYPLVRFNEYQVAEYLKHKTNVDEFVQTRNTISYNFDCFKIVKKFERADKSEGKLTAYFEGENNKILDKMEMEYKGPKGQITATAYFLHGNIVFLNYEIRKGKIDQMYLVYGDFLEALQKADNKAAAHVSGTSESNRDRFLSWLKTIDSWKDYAFNESEEFATYENKSKFIALPY